MKFMSHIVLCLFCSCITYVVTVEDEEHFSDLEESQQYTAKYRSYLPVNQRQYPYASHDRKPRKKGFKKEW